MDRSNMTPLRLELNAAALFKQAAGNSRQDFLKNLDSCIFPEDKK